MQTGQYREIWIDNEEGQSLCALINGDKGWLMYLRHPGDAGLHSINPEYSGADDATLYFVLDNGQRDEYPLTWVLPIADVERALSYFRQERTMPSFIVWHDDAK